MEFRMLLFLPVVLSAISLAATGSPAPKPPLGWNSYDCLGAAATEAEVMANTDYMADHLAEFGWEYIVIDYCWSYPTPGYLGNPQQNGSFHPRLAMDAYGRLLPAERRFPSAAGGKGFKPLADYVHSRGLKFGIHVMRGIPRQAVAADLPVLGTTVTAKAVADTSDICTWLNHMYGVDLGKQGGQEYYDSLIALYTGWGVDYIKVDDLLADGKYHEREIQAVRRAIDKCGRTIVFSLSPGNSAPVGPAEFLKKHTDMWRISGDFWDEWDKLKRQFDTCESWAPHIGPGHWPDADMLPLGRLSRRGQQGPERWTRFTEDEQVTLMTLWCIFRSPLMMGGDLTMIDPSTLSLLTNPEVLAVNQESAANRPLFRRGDQVAWAADVPGSKGKYLALFNLGETKAAIPVPLAELGLKGRCLVRDLWKRENIGPVDKEFAPELPPHGAGLYKLWQE